MTALGEQKGQMNKQTEILLWYAISYFEPPFLMLKLAVAMQFGI